MKAAVNELHSVSSKWHSIGVQLNIPLNTLRNIKQEFSDTNERLSEMLDIWMSNAKGPDLSWGVIVGALKAPSVGENKLAGEIEKKYCAAVEQGGQSEDKEESELLQGMHII